MGWATRALKLGVQGVFYLAILALIVSRSVSTNFSHDENQFIAPGQLLAYQGLLPYVDYPYTHMPYGAIFYAVSALVSDFDFLAGRLLSCLMWFGCILLIVALARSLRRGLHPAANGQPSWQQLLWEFLFVYVFVNYGPVLFVLSTALNHSLASFFSLLGTWFLVRGMLRQTSTGLAASFSGAFVMVAGLIRFNYISLVAVLFVFWLAYWLWLRQPAGRSLLGRCAAGALIAGLPAAVLIALAPRAFYYSNLVYIRLNTIYYQELLRRSGMDLGSKLQGFATGILVEPLAVLLYAVLLYTAAASTVNWIKERSLPGLAHSAVAAIAITLWLTAFAPTPTLLQYFAAPAPFLFVLLAAFELRLPRFEKLGQVAEALLVLLASARSINFVEPWHQIRVLSDPAQWPPVQMHEVALSLREHVHEGRVLTLQPMVPLEAGLETYPFTASGPFSWRTSLLLTPQRRQEYGVTSPEELPTLLNQFPPAAVLVGFEAPNAGFEFQQLGALEKPFSDYAMEHGYQAVDLTPPFWPRGLTLWVRP